MATCAVRDFPQKRDGRVIGDEYVEPPPTGGIGFQMVEEAMAVLGQFPSKPISAGVRGPLFATRLP